MSASTALLPAARPPATGTGRGSTEATRVLDAVHDHVLRLLGDPAVTTAVIADVALRVSARAADQGTTDTSLTSMLSVAHARLAVEERHRPAAWLVTELAGVDPRVGPVLVTAMSGAALRGAALLDLTTRHGLDLRAAGRVLGLERSHAEALRTDALRQVRADLVEAGVGLETDVAAALAGLPVIPAAQALHDRLEVTTDMRSPTSFPPLLAWLGTAAVTAATVGALTVALPWIAAGNAVDRPVVIAEELTEEAMTEELAELNNDDADDTQSVVVRAPTEQSGTTTSDGDQQAEPEPAPEPAPEPEQSPEPEQEPEQDPEPEPEPEPEPSDPLDINLPVGP